MPQVIPWAVAAIAQAAIAIGVPTAVAQVAGTVVVKTALSAALAVGAQMLMQPSVDRAGSPTQWRANPDQPVPVLTGRMKIAGDIIKRGGFGSQNMYQGIVGIVSGVGPVQGPVSWSVDRQPVTFGPDQKAVAPWGDKLWLSYQLGVQPEPAALASPNALRGGADLPGWTSAHRLSSWAAYMVTLGHDSKQKVWTRGEPEFAGLWDGVLDWDPRQDSTWPGGSGTQRRDDPETWGPHENPILWGLRWARGHWAGVNGGVPHIDKLVAGMGMADDQIDIDSFVQCANLVDDLGWTCAARPTTADDKWQVLRAYLQAGGCYPDTIGGRLTCLARVGPKVSLATLDRSDLLGGIESVRSPRRLVRRNTVHPRYRSPAHDWDMVTADPVSRAVYVSEDKGRTRSRVIDYPYVTQLNQAAVLARYDVADSREGFNGGAAVKAWVKSFPPGSCVDMPDDETLGSLSGQSVMIRSVEVDLMTGGVAIGFAGETASKHSWALAGTTTVAPPAPFTPPSLTFPPPDVADWSTSAGTGATPSVVLTGEVSNPLADAVLVEVRLDGTSDWSPSVQTDQTNLERIEAPVPGPGDWIAAVSYRSAETGIWGARRESAPVSVGGVVIDWTDQPPIDPGLLDDSGVLRGTTGGSVGASAAEVADGVDRANLGLDSDGTVSVSKVATESVVPGSITPAHVAFTAGAVTWAASSLEKVVQTLNDVEVVRGLVRVSGLVDMVFDTMAGASSYVALRLYRDGSPLFNAERILFCRGATGTWMPPPQAWLEFVDNPGPGIYDYELRAQPSQSIDGQVLRRSLIATVLEG